MLKIKVQIGAEWRRLSLTASHEEEMFEELCDKLRSLVAPAEVQKLVYEDEDGDRVLVGSATELQEALAVFEGQSRAPKFHASLSRELSASLLEDSLFLEEQKEAEVDEDLEEDELVALQAAMDSEEQEGAVEGELQSEEAAGAEAENRVDEEDDEAEGQDPERAEFLRGLYEHVPNEARIVVSSLLCSEIERLQLADFVSIFINSAFPFFAARHTDDVLTKADDSGEAVQRLEDHFLALTEDEILVCVRRGMAAVKSECPQLCSALGVLARLFNAPKIELDRFLARLIAGNRWPSGEKFDLSKWLAQTASSIKRLFNKKQQRRRQQQEAQAEVEVQAEPAEEPQVAPKETNGEPREAPQRLESLFRRSPRARFLQHEGGAEVRTGHTQGSVLKGWVLKNTSMMDQWPTQVRLDLHQHAGLSAQLAALNDQIRLTFGGDGVVRPGQVVPIHVRLTTPTVPTTCRFTYRLSYLDEQSLQWVPFGPLLHATVHVFQEQQQQSEQQQQPEVPAFPPQQPPADCKAVQDLVQLGASQADALRYVQQAGGPEHFERALELFLAPHD